MFDFKEDQMQFKRWIEVYKQNNADKRNHEIICLGTLSRGELSNEPQKRNHTNTSLYSSDDQVR